MKWLLTLLMLQAAKTIDPTRPFACGEGTALDHQSRETIHMNLCHNWNEPFLLTNYEKIPQNIKELCATPIYGASTTLTEHNRDYWVSVHCVSLGSKQ